MDLFELVARLKLDKGDYDKNMTDAESKAFSIGQGIGSALNTAGKVAGAAVAATSAALVKFGKDSVQVGMQFDSAISQVGATMGSASSDMIEYQGQTMTALDAIRDMSQELGASTMFSASQAAEGFNVLAMAGYSAEEAMEALPGILQLAAAGGLTIAEAADYATGIIAGFANEMLSASEIGDRLATMASSAKGDVSQFGEALTSVAGMATTTGQSLDNCAVALEILGNNNVSASEAGNALSRTLKNLYQPTDKAREVMEGLGISAYDMVTGEFRELPDVLQDVNNALDGMTDQAKNEVLSQIFDAATLKTVPFLLNGIKSSVTDVDDVIGVLSDTGIDFASSWEGIANDTSSIMEGMAADIIYNVTELQTPFEELTDYLSSEYNLSMEDAAAAVEAVQAVAGDTSAWDGLAAGLEQCSGAAGQMEKDMTDNLQGAMKGWESAVEGIQVAVSDMLTPTIAQFVEMGTSGVRSMTDALKAGDFEGVAQAFGDMLNNMLEKVVEILPNLVSTAAEIVTSLVDGIVANVDTLVDAATEIIMTLCDLIIENLPTLIEASLQIVSKLAEGIAENLPELIPAIVDMMLQIVMTLIDNIGMLIEAAVALITGLAEGLIAALPVLIEKAPEIIQKLVTALIENLPLLLVAAGEIIMQLTMALIENLPMILNAGVQIVMFLISGIVGVTADLLIAIGDLMMSMLDKITSFDVVQWGKDLIQNFVDGILGGIGKVKEAATAVGNGIKKILHFSKPDEGPLADFDTYGPDMMDLLASGIEGSVGEMAQRIRVALEVIKGVFDDLVLNIGDSLKSFGEDLITQIATMLDDLKKKVDESVTALRTAVEDVTKWLTETTTTMFTTLQTALTTNLASMKTSLSEFFTWIKDEVKNVKEAVTTAIDGEEGIFGKIKSSMSAFVTWMGTTMTTLKTTVLDVVTGDDGILAKVKQGVEDFIKTMTETTLPTFFSNVEDQVGKAMEKEGEIFQKIKQFFEDVSELIDDNLSEDGENGVLGKITEMFDAALETVETYLMGEEGEGILGTFVAFYDAMKEKWTEFTTVATESLTEFLTKTFDTIKTWFENLTTFLTNWFTLTLSNTRAFFTLMTSAIEETFTKWKLYIESWFKTMNEFLTMTFEDWGTRVRAWFDELYVYLDGWFTKVRDYTEGWFRDLDSFIRAWFDSLYSFMDSWFTKTLALLEETCRKAVEIVEQMCSDIEAAITSVVSAAYGWGSELGANFAAGIMSQVGAVAAAAAALAEAASGAIHFSEPDVGPMKNFHTFAPDMVDLFIQGMESKEGDLRRATENVFDLRDSIFGGAEDLGESFMDGLIEGIENGIEQLKYTFNDLDEMMTANISTDGEDDGFGIRGGYNQTVIINSPEALDPSEVARQTRNATQGMVLAMRVA